jgi:hypothetical protein
VAGSSPAARGPGLQPARPLRAVLLIGAMGAAALVIALASAEVSSAASERKRAPARLLVVAHEFSYVLSRQKLPAGRVILQMSNAGEDETTSGSSGGAQSAAA